MKKIFCFLIAVLMLLGTSYSPPAVAAPGDFLDLNSNFDWAKQHIAKLASLGYVEGYPDGTFRPNRSVTVAEFMKVLLAISGQEFDIDVTPGWSDDIIQKAYDANLIMFDNKAILENQGNLLRMYVPKSLALAMRNHLAETPETGINAALYIRGYFDIYGQEQLELSQCVSMGLICGDEHQAFRAFSNITRAEACVVLARLADKSMRVTPKKLTGIVETSWDFYELDASYAKDHFNIQMQSSNTFTADMPVAGFASKRKACIGDQELDITEGERGYFTINATNEQINSITHVYYTVGLNISGEGAIGMPMHRYKINGNPFR